MNKSTKTIATITMSALLLFASMFAGYGNLSNVKNLWNSTVEAITGSDGPSGGITYINNSDPGTYTCHCDNYETLKTLYTLAGLIPYLGPLLAAFDLGCTWAGFDPFDVEYKCCTAGSGRCNPYDSMMTPALCKQYQSGYWYMY